MQVVDNHGDRWVRSSAGPLFGVCEGLGRRFAIDPWVLRILWIASILALGTGLLLYLILGFTLPREDQLLQAGEKRFLGVCTAISRRTGMDIGLVRALTVFLALPSLGAAFLVYLILYFALPDARQSTLVA